MHIQMIKSGIFRNRDQTVSHSPKLSGKFHFSFGFARVSEVRHMNYVKIKSLLH